MTSDFIHNSKLVTLFSGFGYLNFPFLVFRAQTFSYFERPNK